MFRLQRSVALTLRIASLSLIIALASLLIFQSSSAQSANDNVSITLSPQSLDTAINVGQSSTNVFRVTNDGAVAFAVEPTAKNFVPTGNEGAIKIEDDDTPYSLAKWITVEPSGPVTVQPKQTADFKVTISVPANADPGGHFGSVVFRTLPSNDPGSAALISQEVAPVILVRVPGDTKEDASLQQFKTLGTPILSTKDITFESIVKNNGNVHVKPSGTVSIFNIFGKQVASVPIQSNNVIPGADRKMNAIWEKPGFRFGPYTARLTMVYGSENKLLTSQTTFMIFPLKQTLPIIIIILILGVIIYRIRRRLLLAFKILAGRHEGK